MAHPLQLQRRAARLLHFAASVSNSASPVSRINFIHGSPRFSVNITLSTGFRQECGGAVLAVQRKSKSSFRKKIPALMHTSTCGGVLVCVGTTVEVGDYNFTKFSVIPSVALVVSIPDKIQESW